MSVHDLVDFHFLRPWWLLALLAAGALAYLAARARRARSRWERVIDADLRDALIERALRKGGPWPALVTGLALAIASLALAGPTWQRLPQPIDQKTDALVIVLDLSLSMYARDVPPSRLIQARHAITDVLRARSEGFTGLVAYAGDAHTVAPLTDDIRTIENLLAALSPDMMPVLGSNPGPALDLARTLMRNAGMTQGRILLVTDGVDRIVEASTETSPNFPISILGVGTPTGAPIPLDFVDQAGRFLTDRQGNTVVAKLDETRLKAFAEMCNGRYATIGAADPRMLDVLSTPLPTADDERRLDRKFDLWADYGYWLALVLIPFALLNFRRGAVALIVCALAPPPAHADWWADLWHTPDQQGYHALQNGDAARAATLFRNRQWQGVAQYRGGDYAGADAHFSADPSPTGHYNRGNALAHEGKYQDAIAAYDATLQATPNDADAAFNKALVEKLLEKQRQANKDATANQRNRDRSQPEDSHDRNTPDASQGDQAKEPLGDAQQSPKQPHKPNAGKPQGQDDRKQQLAQREQPPRDEERDALEQWLRRVPDDPSGLLRRKFQYETNQRLRSRGPDTQDQEHIW
jgi:Ca-activated chloride channel family protein